MDWSPSTKLKILKILKAVVEVIDDEEFIEWIKKEHSKAVQKVSKQKDIIDLIIRTVLNFYGVTKNSLNEKAESRKTLWVKIRYMIANLLLQYSNLSRGDIACMIHKNRCTVYYAEDTLEDWEFTKSVEWKEYQKIKEVLVKEIEFLNDLQPDKKK